MAAAGKPAATLTPAHAKQSWSDLAAAGAPQQSRSDGQ
jgi:hypothetical protein